MVINHGCGDRSWLIMADHGWLSLFGQLRNMLKHDQRLITIANHDHAPSRLQPLHCGPPMEDVSNIIALSHGWCQLGSRFTNKMPPLQRNEPPSIGGASILRVQMWMSIIGLWWFNSGGPMSQNTWRNGCSNPTLYEKTMLYGSLWVLPPR